VTLLMTKAGSGLDAPSAAVTSLEAAQAVSRLHGDTWFSVLTEQPSEPWQQGFVGGLPSYLMHDGAAVDRTSALLWRDAPVIPRRAP